GIHPHEASLADEAQLLEIERLAAGPRVVATGETGLDFFRNLSPHDAQARAFRAQLALARRARKPVLVHCRDAHEETLAILAEVPVSETGGIMHCFSGDTAVAKRCLDFGLLISLAGPVTYPKPGALPEVATLVPADRPVRTTDPASGRRGHRGRPCVPGAGPSPRGPAEPRARGRGRPLPRRARRGLRASALRNVRGAGGELRRGRGRG